MMKATDIANDSPIVKGPLRVNDELVRKKPYKKPILKEETAQKEVVKA